MTLTPEQSAMVEENHSLIYWYANIKHLDLDNWYDLLAIELCYTVMKYDAEKGSLSNYYKLRADNLVKKEYAKSQLQKNFTLGDLPLEDAICGSETVDLDERIDLEAILEQENTGQILKMRANGYTQAEIADILGVTQSYISKIIDRKRREYYDR